VASEAPAKTKEIPAQADVRIVGGKTNVKLRAYGVATCARMSALLTELMTNAVTHPGVSATSQTAAKAVTELLRALNSERE
jgi:hypothetical protein